MGLDRGVLARVDRRLLAGLGGDETWRMVRIPVTPAMWSTWRRYCDTVGVSMGRAIIMLIGQELRTVVDETTKADGPPFSARREKELASWQSQIVDRERGLSATEDRLNEWTERLGTCERDSQIAGTSACVAQSMHPSRSGH